MRQFASRTRRRKPQPVPSKAGIAVCLALMASLPRDTWIRLVVWLVLGFVVYGAFGARHSRLRWPQPASLT
jgi:APA family basic amino acid/polyamine antiporter